MLNYKITIIVIANLKPFSIFICNNAKNEGEGEGS